MTGTLLLCGLFSAALAEPTSVPSRQIPPAVLVEVQLLENRFDLALSMDCDASRCFSKGCTYVDHAVADRPEEASLPGLGLDPGPTPQGSQEYLTQARCAFAHEKSLESRDVRALVRRLQSKLSTGWTVVSVTSEALQPLPRYLSEPAAEEEAPEEAPEAIVEEVPEAEPEPPAEWSWNQARQELWTTLLPHFFWMIGLGLFTFCAGLMIWSWRRVGRASLEEQALLAQIAAGSPDTGTAPPSATPVTASPDSDLDARFIAEQHSAWATRLQGLDASHPDAELQGLIRELLRSGGMPLLAKAALRFPELPSAFPAGGDVADAKLELAAYLREVDEASLPSDVVLYETLNRYALSASLASQSDTEVLRSLREDFGTAGLASLLGALPPRPAALLFALAPSPTQRELVAFMSPIQAAERAAQLLASNRMARSETAALFEVLRATRDDLPLPKLPDTMRITDRGTPFEAARALSVLLTAVEPAHRAALFESVLQRFHGTLPTWHRDILVPDMLLELSEEGRADLFLGVEAQALAAWLTLVAPETRSVLVASMPSALQATVQGLSAFASDAQRHGLAEQGRQALARGFQQQLARARTPFERVVVGSPRAEA